VSAADAVVAYLLEVSLQAEQMSFLFGPAFPKELSRFVATNFIILVFWGRLKGGSPAGRD
jgi:hypothetical protein